MIKKPAFWAAFWQGVAAPTLVLATPPAHHIDAPAITPITHGRSDLDAMRGDWCRVGEDFRHVISREEASGTHSAP
jgi:hypothetical protein